MSSSGPHTIKTGLDKLKLGIIGGSGMCTFPEAKVVSRYSLETKYGSPSGEVLICEHAGQTFAFLPRHGAKHTLAPHAVPYRANLEALKMLGVEYVLGTCIVGSLKKEIPPGSFVVLDQFVNLTWGRDKPPEVDGGSFIHLPMGEPYCAHLRHKLIGATAQGSTKTFFQGTVAVIQGPRFSTAAESRWLSTNGWDVVNMTQYPECYFARELGLCYAAFAAVTDYDVGLQESLVIDPEKMRPVLDIFKGNVRKTKDLLLSFVAEYAATLSCGCAAKTIRAYYEDGL